eukprot:103245_1
MKIQHVSRQIFAEYRKLLVSHPIPTKAITSGVLFFTGDMVCQHYEITESKRKPSDNIQKYNVWRGLKMASYGFFFIAPVLHGWYGFLERRFPGQASRAVFKKVIVDQSIAAPILNGTFYIAMGMMEWKSYDEIRENLRAKYMKTLFVNYLVWPFVQLSNFYFIPLPFRVPWVNMWGFFYNSFLSRMQHLHHDEIDPCGSHTY